MIEKIQICTHVGEYIGSAVALLPWPLYACNAPGDPTMVGKTRSDCAKYCRVHNAPGKQVKCSGYLTREALEKTT